MRNRQSAAADSSEQSPIVGWESARHAALELDTWLTPGDCLCSHPGKRIESVSCVPPDDILGPLRISEALAPVPSTHRSYAPVT